MRKIKMNMLMVAALAIGAVTMSFKMVENAGANGPQASYRWFQISGAHSTTATVPPSDAIYLNTGAAPSVDADECSGSGHQCVSGFNENQTIASGSSYQLDGNQVPQPSAPNLVKD